MEVDEIDFLLLVNSSVESRKLAHHIYELAERERISGNEVLHSVSQEEGTSNTVVDANEERLQELHNVWGTIHG